MRVASIIIAIVLASVAFAASDFVELPASSDEYAVRSPGKTNFGEPEVIDAFRLVAHVWHHDHPKGPSLQFNDISSKEGGPLKGHASHQKGIDADVVTRGPNIALIEVAKEGTDERKLALELLKLFRRYGVSLTFWNGDPGLAFVQRWPNHDDHFHVRFAPDKRLIPGRILDQDLARGVTPLDRLTAKAPARPEDRRPIHSGQVGAEVSEVQALLVKHGFELKVDEDFGPATEKALREFQRKKELFPVDGIVGGLTWKALLGKP
jgi:hypothetical protein